MKKLWTKVIWIGRDIEGPANECDYNTFAKRPYLSEPDSDGDRYWRHDEGELFIDTHCCELWQKYVGFGLRPGGLGKITITRYDNGTVKSRMDKIIQRKKG